MARTTTTEVKEIIDTTLTDLTAFITAANLVVSKVYADDDVMTDVELKEVERWLAAHYVAIRDPVARAEQADKASATYAWGDLGKGLEFTPYGQMALTLDLTGKLQQIGKRKTVFQCIDISDVG